MENEMIVGLASDHAGFPMKEFVKRYLAGKGIECKDFGTYSDASCDYPDFAHPLAEAIESGAVSTGIGVCGSGEGMAMTLNKHHGVRAGLVWNVDVTRLIRQHNNANAMVLPGRFVSEDEAAAIVDAYLDTPFEGGRHQVRIDKM